jgi:hypothetical protein
MKLKDTTINTGGMLRCCVATIDELDKNMDFPDGLVLDCKYESPRNKSILLKDGVWQWNIPDDLVENRL